MGKKPKKPGRGKEKAERKMAKAEEKKVRRDNKKLAEEDDIDAILAKILKEEEKKTAVTIEENVTPPSPRCNCSLTLNPIKDNELIFYGGEFFNGTKTFVYGDLYRYNIEKNQWNLVSSLNSPPPRSAHQAVGFKNYIYIFGGEFTSPNQERFHHYKDLWRLDLNTNVWECLNLKNSPSPRSGHRMVIHKHKLIIFGGFYDTLREVRYFNDLHVLDLDDLKWQEIKPKIGGLWPSQRSGFQMFVNQDDIFIYGGYYKSLVSNPKSKSTSKKEETEKSFVLSDIWKLNPSTWEWSKVKRLGNCPSPRAGFSISVNKKKAYFFGGTIDREEKGDLLRSEFLNEMFIFQLENYRWFSFELKKQKENKSKVKKSKERHESQLNLKKNVNEDGEEDVNNKDGFSGQQQDADDNGNEYYDDCDYYDYYDDEGNEIIREEKNEDAEHDEEKEKEEREIEKENEIENERENAKKKKKEKKKKKKFEFEIKYDEDENVGKGDESGDKLEKDGENNNKLQGIQLKNGEAKSNNMENPSSISNAGTETILKKIDNVQNLDDKLVPCGRINACVTVTNNTLYLYGGIMEINDREITLDDFYSLDLNKHEEWKCILEATHSDWIEASESDEEDEDEDDEESGEEDSDEDVEDEEESLRNTEEENASSTSLAIANAAKFLRGEGKRLSKKDRKIKIDQIRSELGLSDANITPLPGESLRDFFARTNIHWQTEAYENTNRVGKELRKDGFELCEIRYKELRPVLDELERLELEQKEEEAEELARKNKKKHR